MKQFLTTKLGVGCVAAFTLLMAGMFYRVQHLQRPAEHPIGKSPAPVANSQPPVALPTNAPAPGPSSAETAAPAVQDLTENAAYLDQYYQLDSHARRDRDEQGNPVTHRDSARTPSDVGKLTPIDDEEAAATAAKTVAMPIRSSLRLAGRGVANGNPLGSVADLVQAKLGLPTRPLTDPKSATTQTAVNPSASPIASALAPRPKPKRFNPYGSVIKCELVFTLDSVLEEAPLVGLVMEPVYNNGQLVIPAGAEFHGVARPDRLRDRIFSGNDWVLVFPREHNRPNGRQLNVRGVVLDRVEPDASGVTWGLTDGSYGLEGTVIRTMQDEEIKRFASTFLAEAAQTLESRSTDERGREVVGNTPQNALLQGLSANLSKIASDITAEIEKHGVFIRVPAGHQFYFYPTQIIDPDVADISSDIATVK